MTIEEKAIAYDKAIKKAKITLGCCNSASTITEHTVYDIFPELKESENERIRKELISFLQLPHPQFVGERKQERWLAWLEKQAESIKIKKGKNYLCTKTHKYGGSEWIEGVKYYSPEDYSLVNQGCTYYCPEYSKEEHNNFFREVEYDGCLEVDKVEPKSQIIKDIWYICTCTTCSEDSRIWFKKDMVYLGNDILKYDLGFELDDYQDYFRLWTILDAKDGDVLCYETKNEVRIFIYKGYGDTHYHCCYYNGHLTTVDSFFVVPKYLESYIHPATKEQCDILFTKIREAKFEWDAHKKELKKIEQKAINEVKPKFKVGDWIACKGLNTALIVNINDDRYEAEFINSAKGFHIDYADRIFHLWTIADAKDGDVLAEDSCIFIVQKLGDNNTAKTYYTLYDDGDFDDGSILSFDIDSTKPATKEQRDLLFTKMKEAGYRWNADEKKLEKIEQKSAKKVESKFHEGDWVVYDHRPYQVVELPKEGYINLGLRRNGKIEFAPSPYCRHWTIQDAKDGDILATDNYIFIFRYYDGDIVWSHCDLYGETTFCKNGDPLCRGYSKPLSPATIEQRDLLFQKMKEVGYEWDAENKKLKKIEHKSSDSYCREHCKGYQETGKCFADGDCDAKREADNQWSEDDEKMVKQLTMNQELLIDTTREEHLRSMYEKEIKWLESIKEKVLPKQEWSEEDEKIYQSILDDTVQENQLDSKQIDWLKNRVKSLRPQNKWKPSDEQMDALEYYATSLSTYSDRQDDLFSLLKPLKKLMEE